MFIPRAQPHALAQYFFLFPIVLVFFDEKKDGAARNSIVCFGASIPCHARHLTEANEEWEVFLRVQRFWHRKVWTQRLSRGEKLRRKFLARKSAKFFANTEVQIFGKEKCKTHRQFQRHYRKTPLISTYVFSGLAMVQVLIFGAVLTFGGYDKAEANILQGRSLFNLLISVDNALLCSVSAIVDILPGNRGSYIWGYVLLGHCSRQQISEKKNEGYLFSEGYLFTGFYGKVTSLPSLSLSLSLSLSVSLSLSLTSRTLYIYRKRFHASSW